MMTLSEQTSRNLTLALAIGAALATAHTGAGAASAQSQSPSDDIVAPNVDRPAGPEGVADDIDAAGPGSKISGDISLSYNSHFISYGGDVWGGGDDFFGSQSTGFVTANVALDLAPFTVHAGIWSDINDNVEAEIGGEIQEIDIYAGVSYTVADFTLDATYQEWYYAGDEERIVDLSVSYDDTGKIIENFAFNPSFLAHLRVDGNGGQEKAEAYVLGIAPSYTLLESTNFDVALTIPASVAFFSDEFQGGDSGFGYVAVGASLSSALKFIPAEYGSWSGNVGVTYYHTDDDAIPNNPESDFLTGSVGISLAF